MLSWLLVTTDYALSPHGVVWVGAVVVGSSANLRGPLSMLVPLFCFLVASVLVEFLLGTAVRGGLRY